MMEGGLEITLERRISFIDEHWGWMGNRKWARSKKKISRLDFLSVTQ